MPPAEQQKVIRYLCLLTIIIIILSQIARWFLFSCSLFVKSLCQSLPLYGCDHSNSQDCVWAFLYWRYINSCKKSTDFDYQKIFGIRELLHHQPFVRIVLFLFYSFCHV